MMSLLETNVYVVMGACGCGKTTISTTFKEEIEKRFKNKIKVSFIDGDELHSEYNKQKMRNEIPLNDNDRIPWLYTIREKIESHKSLIMDLSFNKLRHILLIACSALKYSYREILRGNYKQKKQLLLSPNNVSFIMLDGTKQTLQNRLNNRKHEYMPINLLESQLNSLDYPNKKYIENDIIIQSIDPSISEIVDNLIDKIILNNNITNYWKQSERIISIICEYNIWYVNNLNKTNQININIELMNLYSIIECINDFVYIYQNDKNGFVKYRINNLLNINSYDIHNYTHNKFKSIMSNHNQKLYFLTLHCILCYFVDITIDVIDFIDLYDNLNTNNNNNNNIINTFTEIMQQNDEIKCDIDELNENLYNINFNCEEKYAIKLLLEMNQEFIFRKWDKPGINDDKKKELLSQIIKLDSQYPGGLKQYYMNACELINNSQNNINPYKGWIVNNLEINKDNINIEFGTNKFIEYENLGETQFGYCGFVLLGGGFGERLGYNGIKTGLPSEISTNISYIELYIRTLLSFQERARIKLNKPNLLIPFACTTSGIGHNLTKTFLENNNYFGLNMSSKEKQFTFLAQELVASFSNNKCEFALSCDNYEIIEKPHGHGDVHSLMYKTGLAKQWYSHGIKWIICLQDTNAVAIKCVSVALGVSLKYNFAMNSIGTRRLKGESYGAICKLINNKNRELIVNVEYNQLNSLLNDNKDINIELNVANTNTLIIRSDTYYNVLNKTKGMVTEFVNPKYINNITKDKFKTPTRLECMMQDYPKLLFKQGYNEKIGVTTLPKWIALQPVKKNIKDSQIDAQKNKLNMAQFSAGNGEASIYFANRKYINQCNVNMIQYNENMLKMFNKINIKYGPRIVLLPSFGMTLKEIKYRFSGKSNIKITNNSTLILDGNIIIKKLYLNGTLIIKTGTKYGNNTQIIIDGLNVENNGWKFEEIKNLNDKAIDDVYKLRGYTLSKLDDGKIIQFDDGKQHIIT